MDTSRFLTALIMVFLAAPGWGCEPPSVDETAEFFAGHSEWVMVEGPTSNKLHQKHDILINLNFNSPQESELLWDGEFTEVRNLRVCQSPRSNEMIIRSNWPRVRVIRMGRDVMQIRSLGFSYYMRPSHGVISL